MSEKVMARPKGTPYPFQPIHKEEDGMYALQFTMARGWKHTAWYKPDELEMEQ